MVLDCPNGHNPGSGLGLTATELRTINQLEKELYLPCNLRGNSPFGSVNVVTDR